MRRLVIYLLLLCIPVGAMAQNEGSSYLMEMGLHEVIATARNQSPQAVLARHNFLVSYWQFRSYKAQFLPSLNLSGSLGNYNRSLISLQNSETGTIGYLENNTLRNSLGLSVNQNIPLTGGTFSVTTSLERLDQFSPSDVVTYNSQPVRVTFSQPINGFNTFKWEKKIEPEKFKLAKQEYLSAMEDITVSATRYFFTLLIAQKQQEFSKMSRENTLRMYNIAKERFAIGSITRDELLQLELKLLNDSITIADNIVNLKSAMQKLRNFLGFNEKVVISLMPPPDNGGLELEYDMVMAKVNENSPQIINNFINRTEADKAIAQAKSNAGIKASIYAQFGLNQVGEDLDVAYRSPLDQEVIGVTLSVPIVDWGLGKGRVKVAKSKAKVVQTQIDQVNNQLSEDVSLQVMRFNMQGGQCDVAKRAKDVGQSRYKTTQERFINGTIGVMELNNAQAEMDQAQLRYLNELCDYWVYYYDIRRMTLYDFVKGENLIWDFDELLNE